MARAPGAGRRRIISDGNGGSKTDPDPSVATTDNMLREISHTKEFGDLLVRFVREVTEQKIVGVREALEARLNGNDQAVTLLRSTTDKVPGQIETAVTQLSSIVAQQLLTQDEKFGSIKTQFIERDTRTEQTTKDSVKAIEAAFASAEKAINKTEGSFDKRIGDLGDRIDVGNTNANEKIDDLKQRVTTIESRTAGITQNALDNRQVVRDSSTTYLSLAALAAAVVIPLVLRLVH